MAFTERDRRAKAGLTSLLLCAGLLFAASPALGQAIKVNQAVPPEADQGSTGVVVHVLGENFPANSRVSYYVTGTTNPGGIAVKNVRWVSATDLETTIDVALDAQTDLKFDIVVKAGGRTGKGTELFKVVAKVTGPDTTPPETVTDLALVGEPTLSSDGDYVAQFTWTSPADDHGTVASSQVIARPGTSFTAEDLGRYWPGGAGLPAPPGSPDSAVMVELAEDQTYTAVHRSCDEAGNCSDLSEPVTFTTGPASPSAWMVEEIDHCPPGSGRGIYPPVLAVAADGSAFVQYERICEGEPPGTRYTAFSAENWLRRPFPYGGACAAGFDPAGNVPTAVVSYSFYRPDLLKFFRWNSGTSSWDIQVVDSAVYKGFCALSFGDTGPVIVYRVLGKGQTTKVRLAIWNGTAWEKHDVTSTWDRGDLGLALDPDGRAAVVYQDDTNHDQLGDTTRFALWTGTSWQVETLLSCSEPGLVGCGATPVWNPATGEFWALAGPIASGGEPSILELCRRAELPSPVWTCERIPEPGPSHNPAIDINATGTVFVRANADDDVQPGYRLRLRVWSRDTLDPSSPWTSEIAEWDSDDSWYLKVDPTTGLPVTVTYTENRPIPDLRVLRRLP